MQTSRINAWIWLPPLVAAALYALVFISGNNHALFLALNHAGHAMGYAWWDNLTILGDGAVALVLVLPMLRRSPRCFWAALIAAVITGISVQVFKHAFPYPRPLTALAADPFFHSGPPLRAGSFPSGHGATIFALAGIITMGMPGRDLVRWLLLGSAALVSVSRVMVGVHWPLDVLAGMLIGWSAAYSGLAASGRLSWDTRNFGGVMAAVVLIGIAAGLLVSRHTGYVSALGFQHLIGLSCLLFGIVELYLLLVRDIAYARPGEAATSGLGAGERE